MVKAAKKAVKKVAKKVKRSPVKKVSERIKKIPEIWKRMDDVKKENEGKLNELPGKLDNLTSRLRVAERRISSYEELTRSQAIKLCETSESTTKLVEKALEQMCHPRAAWRLDLNAEIRGLLSQYDSKDKLPESDDWKMMSFDVQYKDGRIVQVSPETLLDVVALRGDVIVRIIPEVKRKKTGAIARGGEYHESLLPIELQRSAVDARRQEVLRATLQIAQMKRTINETIERISAMEAQKTPWWHFGLTRKKKDGNLTTSAESNVRA